MSAGNPMTDDAWAGNTLLGFYERVPKALDKLAAAMDDPSKEVRMRACMTIAKMFGDLMGFATILVTRGVARHVRDSVSTWTGEN